LSPGMAAIEETKPTLQLFVGQIPLHITTEELTPVFEEFGQVKSISLVTDRASRQSKGKLAGSLQMKAMAKDSISLHTGLSQCCPAQAVLSSLSVTLKMQRPRWLA